MATEAMYPDLYHVGIVVADFDQSTAANVPFVGHDHYYRRFHSSVEGEFHGEPASWEMEIGLLEMGGTKLELIQPVGERASPYSEFYDAHGAGVHHLAYVVTSIDEHIEKARAAGTEVTVVVAANLKDGAGRYVYASGLVDGVLVELVERWKPLVI